MLEVLLGHRTIRFHVVSADACPRSYQLAYEWTIDSILMESSHKFDNRFTELRSSFFKVILLLGIRILGLICHLNFEIWHSAGWGVTEGIAPYFVSSMPKLYEPPLPPMELIQTFENLAFPSESSELRKSRA